MADRNLGCREFRLNFAHWPAAGQPRRRSRSHLCAMDDADQTMIRAVSAGARFVRFGGFDFIAIVMPEQPDYVENVLADSALLAVDPQVLAGCLPASFLKKADAL